MKKLALITGGTSGIGFGAAQALGAQCNLALAYAGNHEKAQSSLKSLRQQFPESKIELFAGPLKDSLTTTHLIRSVETQFQQSPSILVNAAGRIDDGLFLDLEFERHQAIIQEHLITTMSLCHLCLKSMYREKWGRIVNLSSISATYAKRGQSNYAAAKAGIEGFTKTLALEVAHRGVTVNAIAPGLIDTPMTANIMKNFEENPRDIRKRVPAGYAGTPVDTGALIAFLASDSARYITGQVITIDGGRSLGDPSS
jgi:3-oxoacyl-[acyl-carrier protein] reductase